MKASIRTKAEIAGAAAAALVLFALPAHAQNLLTNPGFASSLAGWDDTAGKTWSAEDSDGSGSSGSVEIVISDLDSAAITQCVPVAPGESYEFGADVRIAAQGQAEGRAGVVVRLYTDAQCTPENELGAFPANTFVPESLAADWTSVLGQLAAEDNAHSALVEARATKTAGSQSQMLTANLDDVFLRLPEGAPACADPVLPYGDVTTSDALHVLRASVGSVDCDPCLCDVNGSGETSVTDALAVLKAAVGLDVPLNCPVCG